MRARFLPTKMPSARSPDAPPPPSSSDTDKSNSTHRHPFLRPSSCPTPALRLPPLRPFQPFPHPNSNPPNNNSERPKPLNLPLQTRRHHGQIPLDARTRSIPPRGRCRLYRSLTQGCPHQTARRLCCASRRQARKPGRCLCCARRPAGGCWQLASAPRYRRGHSGD